MTKVNGATKQNHSNHRPPPIPAKTCRLSQAEAMTGIQRTHWYNLEKAGLVRLIRIKVPGAKRGVTVIEIAELDRLIEGGRGKVVDPTSLLPEAV